MFIILNVLGQTITELGLAPLVVEIVKIIDVVLCGVGRIG